MRGICALDRNVLLEADQAFNTLDCTYSESISFFYVFLPNTRKHNDTYDTATCRSLPHPLRLSAEKCKPNARSSWSSSPGQNGSWSHHQNNALAPQRKHPFHSLLIISYYRCLISTDKTWQNMRKCMFFPCLRLAHESCRPCNWWSHS